MLIKAEVKGDLEVEEKGKEETGESRGMKLGGEDGAGMKEETNGNMEHKKKKKGGRGDI